MARLGRRQPFKPLIQRQNLTLPTGPSSGAAAGVATVTGVGAAVKAAIGTAAGSATAAAVGSKLGINTAIGAAAGSGAAAAIGRSTKAAVGSAAGAATIAAVSTGGAVGLTGIDLQMTLGAGAFAAAGFNPTAFGGSAWTSVMADTRTDDPIVLDYGVTGNEPSDRIGATGTLQFTLNNAADNSGATVGLYSPLNALRRTRYDLNAAVRLVFSINGQTYHKFLGRLADINPEPGRNGTFRVPCTAVDLMDDWAANDMPVVIPVTMGQNAANLLSLLFTYLQQASPDLSPESVTLETGIDTLPFAFHDPNRKKIRELIIDLVMSEFGFASFRGGPYAAGNFHFLNRHAATTYPISASLINQFSVDSGFQCTMSRDQLASSIEVLVYPTAQDATDTDLFQLDGSPISVLPFQTSTLHLPFKNPARPDSPVAALHLVTPVAHVDYTMNTLQDGTGTDVTDNFVVTHVYPFGGFEAVLTVTNSGAPGLVPGPPSNVPTGFITLLKGRGKGLYISEAAAKVDIDTQYGRRPLQVVMPMQANVNTASDIAHFFGNIYRNTFGQVDSVKFCANKTLALMNAAIFLEPGDLIYLQEDVSGVVGTFQIQGVHLDISEGIIWCTWRLVNVDRQKFWLLGTIDRAELGLNTILGF